MKVVMDHCEYIVVINFGRENRRRDTGADCLRPTGHRSIFRERIVLLDVKDLKVNYKKVEAVKGVSFFVEEGTLVSIIGANGAGKTTIMKTLSGLLRASIRRNMVWRAEDRQNSGGPNRQNGHCASSCRQKTFPAIFSAGESSSGCLYN